MRVGICCILVFANIFTVAGFYDDFSDNDITDWEISCLYGEWTAGDYMAQAQNTATCATLLAPEWVELEDCVVTARTRAVHVCGMAARMYDPNNGVCAYVSPDHDVARIRRIYNGDVSTKYKSIYDDFPSNVWYELTFTCIGDSLIFLIEVPSTGQQWEFSAIDPDPVSGRVGLMTGGEYHAYWDWFQAIPESSSINLNSMTVDDDMSGGSSGDGDMAFEPGEYIEFEIGIRNDGSETLENTFGVLQSLSPKIQVLTALFEYGNIPPGENTEPCEPCIVRALSSAQEQTTYPMQITIFADNGVNQLVPFAIPIGCGISYDCEGDTDPYPWIVATVENGWLNNWHVSDSQNHTSSGVYSFKCGDVGLGDYDDLLYCAIESPFFNIPINGVLSFWMRIDAQLGSDNQAYDGGLLQIGQFDNWETIEPVGGYPYEIVSNSTGPFVPSTGVFSGYSDWHQVLVEFMPDQCGPMMLRYVFGSDAAGNREGWYIDDIEVIYPVSITEDPSPDYEAFSASVGPNPFQSITTFNLTGISNDVTLFIYDISGHAVRSIETVYENTNSFSIVWDGLDDSGNPVPSGAYFVQFNQMGNNSCSLRIIKVD
ncbi:MAG: T9SS type A sorting domain-containing protein [Candidatus Aegiribacteria sp.]|nr:T9SS type A sorting domain-containing protein [Candidatus Aegiribacteria sp.]